MTDHDAQCERRVLAERLRGILVDCGVTPHGPVQRNEMAHRLAAEVQCHCRERALEARVKELEGQRLNRGDSHTCEQFDAVCAERDFSESEIARLRAQLHDCDAARTQELGSLEAVIEENKELRAKLAALPDYTSLESNRLAQQERAEQAEVKLAEAGKVVDDLRHAIVVVTQIGGYMKTAGEWRDNLAAYDRAHVANG